MSKDVLIKEKKNYIKSKQNKKNFSDLEYGNNLTQENNKRRNIRKLSLNEIISSSKIELEKSTSKEIYKQNKLVVKENLTNIS